ncbi:MAG: hypothetical protein E7055_14510 [Lentisphaerae bacterium]|nr:hypothetical protein [Lentisphaerota bacterium]
MEALSAGINNGIILTSTLWNQSGTIYVDGEELPDYTYNQYCPDASSSDKTKTLTGCTNTADSQIIYYWIEQGKNLTLKVSTSDYFYLKTATTTTTTTEGMSNGDNSEGINFFGYDEEEDYTKYFVSDTANVGEGTLSGLNNSLASTSRVGNGDFIAALNFYCGVKNHSGYSVSSTGTYWKYGAYTDGTNAAAYAAAGFDSYYSVSRINGGAAGALFFQNDGLSDVGYSIIRENLDYGEPIRVGIPGHDIYLDGYRKTDNGYEYHLNYGWGTQSSATRWYTEAELTTSVNSGKTEPPLYIEFVIVDISPDVTVSVTSARGDYYGGSFLRGIERINHIVNEKSTTFSFDDSVHNSVIGMESSAPITSKVDVAFQNINAAVITTASSLLSSARGMTFAFNDGAMGVNSSSASYVINETGSNALNISLNSSYLYSGYYSAGAEALNDLLYRASGTGYSYGEFDDSFYSSIKGNAVKSGSAADIITLSGGSGIYGGLDLGGGSNVLNIENGSVFCGSFTGSVNTLTVNMTVDSPDYSGPMAVVKDSSSFTSFYNATGGVLNVTLTDDVIDNMPKVYNLLSGASSDVTKNFSVSLTAPGVSGEILDYANPESGNYVLSYEGSNLGLLYLPGSVEKDRVNLYYGEYLINSGKTLSGVSVNSGLRLEVLGGGYADTITVNASGLMELYSGGSASSNTISVGGTMNVYGGASVNDTAVAGTMNVNRAAQAADITVSAGGMVSLSSGGVLTGSLKIADGGSVEASGGTIRLDISSAKPESSSPIIENISLVSGSPNFVLKMDDYLGDNNHQAEGYYFLATGAAGMDYPITVTTASHELGTLTVNSTLLSGGYSCSLTVNDDGNLGLTVAAPGDQTVMIKHSGSVSGAKNSTETLILKPDYSGIYNLYGSFDEKLNGSAVTLYNGKNKVATGTVKNGKLIFNNGKTVLLDSAVEYTVVLKNNAKGESGSKYSFNYTLQGVSVYWKGRHDDDTPDGRAPVTVEDAPITLAPSKDDDPGWVGFSDAVDYQRFELTYATSLSLSILSNDPIKVTIYDKNMRSMQSVTLKNKSGFQITETTKNKLLEAGTYYLKVESTTAAKGGRGGDYTVSVNSNSSFFDKGDNSDDVRSTSLPLIKVSEPCVLESNGWVGYGDTVDYKRIRLDNAAKLSFTVNANDTVKFQILNASGKVLQTTNVKASGKTVSVSTKELFMDAGEYYLAVTPANASKGGSADYSLSVNSGSRFFPAGDNSDDTWKKASGQTPRLMGEEITGWVGYGDPADFIKFELDSKGQLSLDLDKVTADAYRSKEVKLTCLDVAGKAVALKLYDDQTLISQKNITAGLYYLGVTCANVKKYDTEYSVTTGLLA